jgi:hypothetical protein
MPLTRYLILDDVGSGPRSSVVVGCTKASSNEEALKNAIKFFESADMVPSMLRLERLSTVKRTFPDETNVFWTKGSKSGVIYKCQLCLKVQLGMGGHNHWDYCPLYRARGKRT